MEILLNRQHTNGIDKVEKRKQSGFMGLWLAVLLFIGLIANLMSILEQFEYMGILSSKMSILSKNDFKQCKAITRLADHAKLDVGIRCTEYKMP